MQSCRGSCHCGAVTFAIKADLARSARCDCSMCRRRGAIMVSCDEGDLEILTGAEQLVEYRFNTRVAIHYFCGRCGIYTFHRMRKLPDKFAVNSGCLEDADLSVLAPVLIEGSKVYS